jgi:hypothetical protein
MKPPKFSWIHYHRAGYFFVRRLFEGIESDRTEMPTVPLLRRYLPWNGSSVDAVFSGKTLIKKVSDTKI